MAGSEIQPGSNFSGSLKATIIKSFIVVIALAVVAFLAAVILNSNQIKKTNKLNLIDIPASITIEKLNLGIEESLSQLRGYLTINDKKFKERRVSAWSEKIKPSIRILDKYEWDPENRKILESLKIKLYDLEEEQWYVEDIAPTPGNYPGRHIYIQELSPLYLRLTDTVSMLINHESTNGNSGNQIILELNNLEKTVSQIFSNLGKTVIEDSPHITEVDEEKSHINQHMNNIFRHFNNSETEGIVKNLSYMIESFYELNDQVINIQKSESNIIKSRLVNFTIPKAASAKEDTDKLLAFLNSKKVAALNTIQQSGSLNRNILLVLLVTLAISALFISFKQAGRIIQPVLKLNDAAIDLSKGKAVSNLQIDSDDELGQLSHSFNIMKKQLGEREHNLKVSEAKNKGIIDTAVDGIITLDCRGIIQMFNNAAERLFGYKSDEVVGKNVKMLMPDPYHSEHDGYLKNYINSGIAKIIGVGREVIGLRKDGKEFPAYLSVGKMELDGEIYFTGIIRNITEEKKQLERIEEFNSSLLKKTARDEYFVNLSRVLRESMNMKEFSDSVLNFLMTYFKACSGIIYSIEKDELVTVLSKGVSKDIILNKIKIDEGIAGKVAADLSPLRIFENHDGLKLNSGIAEIELVEICLIPLSFQNECNGLIQLGLLEKNDDERFRLLTDSIEMISISLHAIQLNDTQAQLLEESQAMAEELQSQQEELKTSNDTLQSQQEELRVVNEELEMNAKILKERELELKKQNEVLEQRNQENKKMSLDLKEKAKNLEQSNQYKSDFLASMSHELRTPLNSMLILSKILSENKKGNLTDKQTEYANTIHQAGNDLLALINDVLNLAKIDAGKIELSYSRINLPEFSDYIKRHFTPLTKEKGLQFSVKLSEDLPEEFICDLKALQQICRNLIFNAIKFTDEGSISVLISKEKELLSIEVADTGIGIPQESKELIFEAFQQLDIGNTRKYEGTGLGLSITRKLVDELKGEIHVESVEGQGSTFTLKLPLAVVEDVKTELENETQAEVKDNTDLPKFDILIVEDDKNLTKALTAIIEDKGLTVKSCRSKKEAQQAVIERSFRTIILDLNLEKEKSGIEFLKYLKSKNIVLPVIVYTGMKIDSDTHVELLKYTDSIVIKDEKLNERLLQEIDFAIQSEESFSNKLTLEDNSTLAGKKILIVDDDPRNLFSLSHLLEEYDMNVDLSRNGIEALESLSQTSYDIILMDIMMPEMDGYQAIIEIREKYSDTLPILALTAKAMKGEREKCIEIGASDYMSKPIDNDSLIGQLRVWLS